MPLDTVVEALLHFDGKSHGPLSRGTVLQADLVRSATGADGIDVAVRAGDSHIVEWHHFNFSTIAAAIISYCRAKRIPLPYSGVKSLEITREGVAFNIENTVNIARRPAVREDLSGRPLKYARGYEPHATSPASQNETRV
jgi:hypothetical protein